MMGISGHSPGDGKSKKKPLLQRAGQALWVKPARKGIPVSG